MNLHAHGLKIVERKVPNFLPLSDTDSLQLSYDKAETQRELARFSEKDAAQLPLYYEALEHVAAILRDVILKTPPNVAGGFGELLKSLPLAHRIHGLPLAQKRDMLELFTGSAGDVLDRWFESAPIKAAFGFDGIVGHYASPYAQGSAYVLLHHLFGEVNGKKGVWGHAIGGMGAITQAMAASAQQAGVKIQTQAAVQEVAVQNNRAHSVVLENGTEIKARAVVSNLHPQLLFLNMLDGQVLPTDFRTRMQHWKSGSGTFRMNVALSELPQFTCKPSNKQEAHHSAGIIMAPSLGYMEKAYLDAKLHGWSKEPVIEMLIPSTLDDTLAPDGCHVASLFCQHVAPTLPGGKSWDDCREQVADVMIETVNRHAPNFKTAVLGRQIHSPLDLERKFGLVNGDIFHGKLTLDQIYSARPMLGHADYRTPIRGLYMCGSATHPGGGVTGAPGHNAAQEILKDYKRGKFKSTA